MVNVPFELSANTTGRIRVPHLGDCDSIHGLLHTRSSSYSKLAALGSSDLMIHGSGTATLVLISTCTSMCTPYTPVVSPPRPRCTMDTQLCRVTQVAFPSTSVVGLHRTYWFQSRCDWTGIARYCRWKTTNGTVTMLLCCTQWIATDDTRQWCIPLRLCLRLPSFRCPVHCLCRTVHAPLQVDFSSPTTRQLSLMVSLIQSREFW